MIREFLKYTFRGSVPPSASDEVVDEAVEGHQPSDPEVKARIRIVTAINWVMLAVVVLGFADVIALSWFKPESHVPDLVQDVVSGGVGYFLSALLAFVRRS